MFFLATLIAAVAFGVTLYIAMSKYKQHRLEVQKKEAEFIAAMRSGQVVAEPSSTPLTMAMETAMAAAKTAAQGNLAPAMPVAAPAPIPVAVAPAPAKGLACMFCQLPVDMMANDARKWGAKLPDAESGRFVWVHFDCLNRRLTEASRYQQCLEQLVATATALGEPVDPSLSAALQSAKSVLPPSKTFPDAPPA